MVGTMLSLLLLVIVVVQCILDDLWIRATPHGKGTTMTGAMGTLIGIAACAHGQRNEFGVHHTGHTQQTLRNIEKIGHNDIATGKKHRGQISSAMSHVGRMPIMWLDKRQDGGMSSQTNHLHGHQVWLKKSKEQIGGTFMLRS